MKFPSVSLEFHWVPRRPGSMNLWALLEHFRVEGLEVQAEIIATLLRDGGLKLADPWGKQCTVRLEEDAS